jgi:hypothetical protein
MNIFHIGQTVKANMTAQGMTEGSEYVVTVVSSLPDIGWGIFYTYEITDVAGETLFIRNGHIILDAA